MTLHDRYVPQYEVRVGGEPLPAAVASTIGSVSYQDGKNAADRVEVELGNPDLRWLQKHIRGLGFQPFPTAIDIGPVRAAATPEGIFDLDGSLTLLAGYGDGLVEMFDGEVTGVEATFPSGGMPTMRMIAHDKLHRLNRGTGAGSFGFLPDAVVAGIASAKNLLVPAIDPVVMTASTALWALNLVFPGAGLSQGAVGGGESDFQLMELIAKKYGADFWVEGDVLYLSRFIKEYTPALTLKWGESLIDFSPRVSNVGQVAGVSYKFTLREIPLSFLVTVFWDFDRESLGLSVLPGPAAKGASPAGGPALTIVDKPVASPAGVAESAVEIEHELRTKLNGRLTGSLTAVGDHRLRAGNIVRLEGLGPDFSRDYRIASVNHSFGPSGWTATADVYFEVIP